MDRTQFITVKELSKIISTPEYTIRSLAREGKIPAYKLTNKGYLFDYNEVIEHIKKQKV